jgi:hypothetical protein
MRSILVGVLVVAALGCAQPAEESDAVAEGTTLGVAANVAERLEQYAPHDMTADLSSLSDEDRQALALLIEGSRYMDEIFLRQVWENNPELREDLAASTEPGADAARAYFEINFGPWDRLREMEPFIGDLGHPSGAGYYPTDLTSEEFESYVEAHPEAKEALISLTTLVRRDGDDLIAIPYSEAFREWLEPARAKLEEAAAVTSNESLKRFLESRAAAFGTDDYYESDKDWMDLESPVEITIGPYETYEDGLFGYKSAFESFVTVTLPAESEALDGYKAKLPELERNLPIPDEHKNLDRGSESPIRVSDLVYAAGDTKAGVQTLAFNLPNDERVREEKGSKKVLLRNVLRAKYDKVLVPIAERVLAPEDVENISFDAFFNQTLQHELSHGLGPGRITKDGRETEVRMELRELYSTMEEAKADVMGIYNTMALAESGLIPDVVIETLEPSYTAGLFRSARFGVHEAHGQGTVAQFNYLLEKGALVVDEEGRFKTVSEKFPDAIRELLNVMLMLQAEGDYEGTKQFLDTYGQASQALLDAIDRLGDVPTDVKPSYPQADELAP